ncbi:hypothetical protein [Acinetobacter sp. ZOR0008]|uniref:hypothetical protein n=1 Tax=Acinetobacter sp. ZOR0008 TaxID=1339229 RepID=UPI0006460088|nr:hypothetical protein [Acinetobacter sp. ZOR0008]RZH03320.1 hypothetical protein EXE00_18540 [Acinetobacter pittii]
MNNYKLTIKDKDLFELFFNKVPYIWQALDRSSRRDQTDQPACLYKESVQVVRAVEKFVDDLRTGSLPRVAQTGIEVTGHAEFDRSFLVYFNALKFERKMFDMTYLGLGLNWFYYQKFLEEDAVKLLSHTPGIEQVWLNSEGVQERRQQWSPSKFNYEKAWRLINFFTEVQKNPLYIEENNKRTQHVVDNINHAFEHFDTLLSIHQEVYIFLIDVRFVHTGNEPFEQLIEQVLKDRSNIRNAILQLIPDWLRAYTKLEHDYQNGLKLSCILILRSHSIDQEEDVVACLQALLRTEFGHYDAIVAINGNEFIRTHGEKYAVGRVGINTPKRVELFKYWVLSYFFKMDSFAKLIHPEVLVQVNDYIDHQNWQQPEIKKQAVVSKKRPPAKNLAQILQEWNVPKSVWGIKHLADRVADRLLVGQIYYKEFCAEQELSIQYGELLFQLEVFIETMLHNRYPAFNAVCPVDEQRSFAAKDLQVLSSQLGLQYLSIVKQVIESPYLFEQLGQLIQNHAFHTWWFRGSDLMLWPHVQQIFRELPLNQPVCHFILVQFNQRIQNARHTLFSQERLQADGRINLDKHYAQCVRRHVDTREYLNSVLEQNCWAYRIVIEARSSKGGFKQSELSKLFTEFMRLAKRARPCYWLRGYLGVWQERTQGLNEFNLDVILFLNEKCHEHLDSIVHNLDQRWISFLKAKASQKLQDEEKTKYYGSIKPKILMYSVEGLNTALESPNTYHVCLEAYDRQMKKMFIQHVIPYFTYRDLFQAPFSQPVPKALVKGAMPKKA